MKESTVDPHKLEELLTYCMDFSKEMLTRCGEFFPFGAVIKNGELVAVGGHTGEEHPASQEVYLFLQDAFRRDFAKGEIEAAALAVDVNIPQQYDPPHPDGVRVLIECQGYPRIFYIPYSLSKPGVLGWILRQRSTIDCAEVITVEVDPILIQQKDNGEQDGPAPDGA